MAEPPDSSPDGKLVVSKDVIGFTGFDSDALAHVVSGAEFEHRRLRGGRPDMHLLQCCLPHSVLSRGIYSPAVLVTGTFSCNAITFGTMLRQNEPTIVNGSEVRTGTVQFYPENSEMCYRAWPNATWLAFVISRERLLEFYLEHMDAAPDLPATGIVTIEPTSHASGQDFVEGLRDLTRSLHALGSLGRPDRLGQSVENDLLGRIVNLVVGKPALRAEHHPRLRLCAEVMHDTIKLLEREPAEILDLQSMAKATGLSPRTLQRTFRAEYGLCPQEWLRIERLHRVRGELLKSRSSVTRTATRWGFLHLGRFSQHYRELFGERPSETLARNGMVLTSDSDEMSGRLGKQLAS